MRSQSKQFPVPEPITPDTMFGLYEGGRLVMKKPYKLRGILYARKTTMIQNGTKAHFLKVKPVLLTNRPERVNVN